jgi:hypothetical protein
VAVAVVGLLLGLVYQSFRVTEEADYSHHVQPEVLLTSDVSLSVVCQGCIVFKKVGDGVGRNLAEGTCVVCVLI